MEVKISNPVEYFSSLLQLQEQGEADVKIVCQDGFVFSAHKLLARSFDPPSRPSGEVEEVLVAGPSKASGKVIL